MSISKVLEPVNEKEVVGNVDQDSSQANNNKPTTESNTFNTKADSSNMIVSGRSANRRVRLDKNDFAMHQNIKDSTRITE